MFKKILLRIPQELAAVIAVMAKRDQRSFHSMVIHLLTTAIMRGTQNEQK